jgi:hypothetical protein
MPTHAILSPTQRAALFNPPEDPAVVERIPHLTDSKTRFSYFLTSPKGCFGSLADRGKSPCPGGTQWHSPNIDKNGRGSPADGTFCFRARMRSGSSLP